jgi:hypothetical protein
VDGICRPAREECRIVIIDEATGGWGHINVDQIVLTDTKPKIAPKMVSLTREVSVTQRWLSFPVRNGARMREVTVNVGGKVVRRLEMELADGEPEWWAPLDVSAWKGEKLQIVAKNVPEDSQGLAALRPSEEYPGATTFTGSPCAHSSTFRRDAAG